MADSPIRTCIACRAKAPQESLMRVSRSRSGVVRLGAGGRSAYVCVNQECASDSLDRDRLSRALRCTVSTETKEHIREEFNCRLR